ncbi:MFS transporter [Cellulomonas aerilata]|uniref:MFS transporter n=1 Tax=Cellulomonas aerilata TaxID=515326 RepID=UPI0011BFA608|nr:MFS transporter [Cellulomonas aerilata]
MLTDRTFGRYMAGNLVTMLGTWIFTIVAVVVAYGATGSAAVAGAVTAAQFAPQILLGPLAGAAADRWDRRTQAAVGHSIAAAGTGGLAVWVWTQGLDGAVAVPLVAASAVHGIGASIAGPAMLSLVPSLVRPSELPTAVTLGMAPLPLGRALGPLLGTALAAAVHPALAFAVTSACSLAFVVMLRGLRPRTVVVPGEGRDGVPGVWTYLRRNRPLVVLLVCVGAVGVGTDPSITLAPALSTQLTGGTGLSGSIATAFGIGAGLGFAVLPPARRALGLRRYGYAGLLLMAAGNVVSAVGPTVVPVLAGFVLAGAGLTVTMTGLSSTLQMSLPEAIRGRVMALWSVAFVGTRPLAAVANGLVTDHLSAPVALCGVGLVAAGAGCLGLLRGEGSRRTG